MYHWFYYHLRVRKQREKGKKIMTVHDLLIWLMKTANSFCSISSAWVCRNHIEAPNLVPPLSSSLVFGCCPKILYLVQSVAAGFYSLYRLMPSFGEIAFILPRIDIAYNECFHKFRLYYHKNSKATSIFAVGITNPTSSAPLCSNTIDKQISKSKLLSLGMTLLLNVHWVQFRHR